MTILLWISKSTSSLDLPTFPQTFPQTFFQTIPQTFPQTFPQTIPNFSPKLFPKLSPEPMEISMLESDWLAPHHPFQMLNLLQSLPFLIGLFIIKVPRPPHHPLPKSYGHPESMNKLTLNKPAKIHSFRYHT